ncbi:MAG TPA: hypothetical protein VMW62_05635 [Chloroflexota bacterium]|nr:hypothetical protein [Chloroflexota bacterium]
MRRRSGLVPILIVAAVVLVAAAGIFAVQSLEDSAFCSAVPSPSQCLGISSLQTFTNAVYASVAGLLVATMIAVAVGVNVGHGPGPNTSLAKSLDQDEYHLEEYRARRAQLDEWTIMAQARAAEQAARAEMEAEAAAEADAAFEVEAARWVQEEAGEEEAQESETARRSRVLAEHLAHLARARPEAIASVLSGWINQNR